MTRPISGFSLKPLGRRSRRARARAPDRRVCLREDAEVGEEARRRNGNSGASAGALASPTPLQWWENCRWTCRHEYVLRQSDGAKGVPLDDQRTEICVKAPKILSAPSEKP